jgi:octaprenyl-diphosphate synthase
VTPVAAPASLMLEHLYAPIHEELRETEKLFREQLRHKDAFVDELVSHGCLLGGKRLRPALLLLAAKAAGSIVQDHYLLGAVVEMIHTATLVHDDVLDDASTRRHLATVNARWDNEAAVLLGDYLFTHAFFLASTTGSTTACRVIGESTNRVCEGEIRQKGSRGNWQLTEAEYFTIIDGKTAALTECSCRLGAIFAGVEESTIHHLAEFGRLLGMAFQVADDLLDVLGQPGVVGKTLGTDLEKQKPTLPLIHALQNVTATERQTMLEIIFQAGEQRVEKLLPYLEKHDSIGYAKQQAIEFVESAREQLRELPKSAAKSTLELMADFVVQRAH